MNRYRGQRDKTIHDTVRKLNRLIRMLRLIILSALHPPVSPLAFIPLCLTCRWLAEWVSRIKADGAAATFFFPGVAALGLGANKKKRAQHLLGKYIPSPGSPALEVVAKKSSGPFKRHKTSNYARLKKSIWWTFLRFQLCSFSAGFGCWTENVFFFFFFVCCFASRCSASPRHLLAGCS